MCGCFDLAHLLLAFEGNVVYVLMFHLNYFKKCHLLLFLGSHFIDSLISYSGEKVFCHFLSC